MHLNDGQLRALLDHEVEPDAAAHLAACADCCRRADEMAQQAQRVAAHFAALDPQSDRALSAPVALARFKTQRVSPGTDRQGRCVTKEIPMFKKIFSRRYRAAWAMVAIVALLAVSMTFPPVRAWAEGMLAQFRVEKVSVVSIDPTRFQELGVGTGLSQQITQLLSDSTTITKKPIAPHTVASAAEASTQAGFQVRLPTSRSDKPQLTVQGGAAFEMTVNRARAQQLLNEAGASNLVLPASIDGAVIKVNIPVGVAAGYGDCPNLTQAASSTSSTVLPGRVTQSESSTSSTGSPGRTMLNCIILTEIPSPTVDAPPNLNVEQLAELGLQFTGMTKEQAQAYASTVDWTSTLVVPIPRNAAQYKSVNVDGVSGYLIQRPADDAPQYVIIWVKDHIIYAVGGIGIDTTAALAIANSLK
jgi:hypothetical protein